MRLSHGGNYHLVPTEKILYKPKLMKIGLLRSGLRIIRSVILINHPIESYTSRVPTAKASYHRKFYYHELLTWRGMLLGSYGAGSASSDALEQSGYYGKSSV